MKHPFGQVVGNRVRGNVLPRLFGGVEVVGGLANDHGKFNFPVQLGKSPRWFQLVVGAGDRVGGFEEDHGVGWCGESGFSGMGGVVGADTDDRARLGYGGSDPPGVNVDFLTVFDLGRGQGVHPVCPELSVEVAGERPHIVVAAVEPHYRDFLATRANAHEFHEFSFTSTGWGRGIRASIAGGHGGCSAARKRG